MRNTALMLAVATAMTACVSVNKQAMNAKATTELKGQSITYTNRKKPDFAAMTAGKATFALIGAVVAISDGNQLVASQNIADPADAIAVGLIKVLENAHGVHVVTPPPTVSANEAPEIAANVHGAARFVVDAQTINWGFNYFPTDWSHYRVLYNAKVRLIDTETKSVVAEGFCKYVPASAANAPTYEELMANEVAWLKNELNAAVGECVNTLKAEMLAL